MVPVALHNLLCMHAMQFVLPLIHLTPVCAFLRRPEYPHVDIRILDGGQTHFAEQMKPVSRVGDAHGYEVGGAEGCEVRVGEGGNAREVFGFVL
jgi:hypothetical protein